MNDIFAKMIERARLNDVLATAKEYAALMGISYKEAVETMRNIRNQTNWTRKDVEEDEQERS